MTTFLKVIALLLLAGLVSVGIPCGGLMIVVGFGEPNFLGWGILVMAIGLASGWGIFAIAKSFRQPNKTTVVKDTNETH